MEYLPRDGMPKSRVKQMEYCLAVFQQLESALQEDELLEQMM